MTRARVLQAVVLAASIVAVGTLTGCEDGYKVFVDSAVLYPDAGPRTSEPLRLDRNAYDVFVIPAGVSGVIRVGFESQTQYATCVLSLDGNMELPVTRVSAGLFYVERRVPHFAAGRRASGSITCKKPVWPASTFVDTFDLIVVPAGQRITARPPNLDFGNVEVGRVSPARVVTLTNLGSSPAVVQSWQLAGPRPNDFRIVDDRCTGATLRPRGQCVLGVSFAPTMTGGLSAALRFQVAGTLVTEQVTLAGVGEYAGVLQIRTEPSVVSFGDVEISRVVGRLFFVTNTGTVPVRLGRLALAGNQTSWFSLHSDGCTFATLLPNEQCNVNVVFSPTEQGYQSATLQVPTNMPLAGSWVPSTSPVPDVPVSGSGAGPSCTYPYC